ncbi:hypothetical protein MJG53_003824 [Ovis ammon polii x Ovis aries]|uniref:Uncharacterized protein n=1 Tax=Ovis ammon polii x Ovis aries TaxID=2918886 RepID=A0ACB9V831_9CETA|nr:hypothetical protein MJG53_003824 [Ovis ammon polii x Ovis aries]
MDEQSEEESALHNQNSAESTVTPLYRMNLGPSRCRATKETRRRLQRHWCRWHEAHKQENAVLQHLLGLGTLRPVVFSNFTLKVVFISPFLVTQAFRTKQPVSKCTESEPRSPGFVCEEEGTGEKGGTGLAEDSEAAAPLRTGFVVQQEESKNTSIFARRAGSQFMDQLRPLQSIPAGENTHSKGTKDGWREVAVRLLHSEIVLGLESAQSLLASVTRRIAARKHPRPVCFRVRPAEEHRRCPAQPRCLQMREAGSAGQCGAPPGDAALLGRVPRNREGPSAQ